MFVVVVFLEVRPERVESFREAMVRQARRCLELEPGCRQFDVCQVPADPASFVLYEVYADEAAFEAHASSQHYAEFAPTLRDWVASRRLLTYRRISGRPGEKLN